VTAHTNPATVDSAPIVSNINAKGAQAAVMHLQAIGAAESLVLVCQLFPKAPLATILKRILRAADATNAAA